MLNAVYLVPADQLAIVAHNFGAQYGWSSCADMVTADPSKCIQIPPGTCDVSCEFCTMSNDE